MNKSARIEALLQRLKNGDVSAIGELYELIKSEIWSYALSKTKNRHDADDITEDTFVRIYKYAMHYTPEGKPMAWIITIERNLIMRFFELRSRTVSIPDGYDEPDGDESFDESLVKSEFIKEILGKLSDEEREIIVLHAVSGLKHREIASLLSKPLSTVLSKYNRALKKLQAIVKEG